MENKKKTPSDVIAEFLESLLLPNKEYNNRLTTIQDRFRILKLEVEKAFLYDKKASVRTKGFQVLRIIHELEYTVYTRGL